ncbi:MAG: hypothetical protein IGS48_18365 [Oscillatoriales cyanobacterium C42_A2020_001]|nr:hypothetical protein [Leptolyngbyaceae cyanobacterium C42_A2020_001]
MALNGEGICDIARLLQINLAIEYVLLAWQLGYF